MDADAAVSEARHALNNHDLETARHYLTDVMNWINIGGYVPSYFYEVLAVFNDMEQMLSAIV